MKEDISEELVELTEAVCKKTGGSGTYGLLCGEYGYGEDFENDTFMLHRFCWCEKEDCGWCSSIGAMPQLLREVGNIKYSESERLPNFLYKPTGHKVWWYKYIGRGMEYNDKKLPKDWLKKCKESLI